MKIALKEKKWNKHPKTYLLKNNKIGNSVIKFLKKTLSSNILNQKTHGNPLILPVKINKP